MIRTILIPLLLCLSLGAVATPKTFEELTIEQLHSGVARGEFTFAEVTQYYLSNIQKLNPKLNAVIAINPDAYEQARDKDKNFNTGLKHGPLYGVPVILKDNIDTRFLPTTAGSVALKNNVPKSNAPIVDKLLAAGAIILGKANLSELANFKSTKSVSGYSSVGGQTKNPYNGDMTPCGSSSGSAVAVASNLTLVSIGTETDGSIHCPSAMNGVVGFKPSIHHISQQGIIPIAHSQDTAGPIARTVEDAKLTYSVISQIPLQAQLATLKNKRIGVIPQLNRFNQHHKQEFSNTVSLLKNAGATIIDNIELNHFDKVFAAEFDILLYEFNQGITSYLSNTDENVPVKSLKALTQFNHSLGDTKQALLLLALNATDDKKYQEALNTVNKYAKTQLHELFKQHQIDAIIAPTTGAAWPIDPINGDKFSGSSSTLAAVTGAPSITVPMGLKDNLPYAISVLGNINHDPQVLAIAQAIEQLTHARVPPKL